MYLIIVRNPFRPDIREIHNIDPQGRSVQRLCRDIVCLRGTKPVYALNGHIINDPSNSYPTDKDILCVTVEVEMTWGAAMAFAAWLGATGVAAYAVAAITFLAVPLAVGLAVNKLVSLLGLGPEKPDMGSVGSETSPSYSWGLLRPTDTEGNPIPIIFGEHRVAGQIINKFVTVGDDNKEQYNALLAVNDGLVDEIKDIRINDQPVNNYRGVTTYTRLGTLNDAVIPNFSNIVQQHAPDIRLDTEGTTLQTDGNSVERIDIILATPNGLYYSNDKGGLDERHVDVKIQYRAVGASTWNNHGTTRISGSTTSMIQKTVTIDGLSPDQYEVNVGRMSGESTDFREQDAVHWRSFKEIVDEELIYPGIAKYAVSVIATDQLSGGEPRLSCIAKRNTVSVYNSNTDTWESRDAQNPAWAAYALLNEYHGVHHSRILYDEFEEWAFYCAETVEGEPRHKMSIVLDNNSNAWENVQRIAHLGRAVIMRRNTKYGVFVDKPESTVSHIFNMGNIIEGTFQFQYLPMKDRANAVEITYTDPDRGYSNQIVGVYSDNYKDPTTSVNKTSLKIDAAVSRSWAIREAAYKLNSNKYLIRVVEFEAAVDSFAAIVGDLVYFQHMIPHYSDSGSGRIVDAGNDDGSGNPYVQLDQTVTLETGTNYAVLVRSSTDDSFVEKSVQTVNTTHDTDILLLSSNWSEVPQKYDLYTYGQASTYKKSYRITNITRAQDLTRKITCIEYVPEIYNDTSYVIETPSWGEEVTQQAVQVHVNEFLTYSKSGDYQSNIHVSWNANKEDVGSNWDVYLIDETLSSIWADGEFDESFQDVKNQPGIWHAGRTADMNFDIPPKHLVQGHQYTVAVCPAGQGLTATGANY